MILTLLNQDERQNLKDMRAAGGMPRNQMRQLLIRNPSRGLKIKDIYNVNSKEKQQFYNDRTTMQVLKDLAADQSYSTRFEFSGENKLTHATFVPSSSFKLIQTNGNVLQFDCTYKTNRYKLPLLHVVGITPLGTRYSACVSFVSGETEPDFLISLTHMQEIFGMHFNPMVLVCDRELAMINNFKILFPQSKIIICRWHVNKNILKNCKPLFDDGAQWDRFLSDSNNLWASSTEDMFNENCSLMRREWSSYPRVLQYVFDTWINPWKENLVDFWIDQYMHLGCSTSSRAESAHSALKKHIRASTVDMVEAFQGINSFISLQNNELKMRLKDERKKIPQRCKASLYELQTKNRWKHFSTHSKA
jgi:hypothetical protein